MTELLSCVRELCNEGQFLRAYEVGHPLGPLDRWEGTAARLLAARLAFHLGAPNLARRLTLRAYRRAPADPFARAAHTGLLLEVRGPFEAWERTSHIGLAGLPASAAAELAGFRAHAAILLRDFGAAAAVLAEAEAAAAGDHRLSLRRSMLLEAQDRYDDALELALRDLEVHPGSQAAVRWAAHLLVLVDRRDDAVALLGAAAFEMQSAAVVAALAALQADAGRHDDRDASLRRFAELSPLLEGQARAALEAELSDLAYRRGDLHAAITHGRRSGVPAALRIAEQLAVGGGSKRVSLDVPFVRQHRQTCVPATLAALARYWKRPAEHLAVAEAICGDGTPAHSERRWAEENGWEARELTVTWNAVVALLDRGVPIALHTHGPLSGHCQAIIGYDARRGTVTLRDPFVARDIDVLGDELLERHRASGPRGLALVPGDRRDLLRGIELPEAASYDRLHAMHCALDVGDRAQAGEQARALTEQAPDHFVTLAARRALAAYDCNWPELHAVALRSLDLFPKNPRARLDALAALRDIGTCDERVALLESICAEPDCDPIFFARLAVELADDPTQLARAELLARRAAREPRPTAEALVSLASVLWQAGRKDEALDAFRLTACMEDRNERYARMYFAAACAHGPAAAKSALGWLERRLTQLGRRASGAAITLALALEQLDCIERAIDVTEGVLRDQPDNVDACTLLVRCHRQRCSPERALAAARDLTRMTPSSADAHRILADARLAAGDRDGAVVALRRALALQPDDVLSAAALFEAHLEEGKELDAAGALVLLERVVPSAARVLAVRLAIFRGDAETALAHMEKLCTSRTALASQLWGARLALIFAGLGERTHELLASLAPDPGTHDEVGHILSRTRRARALKPPR